MLAFWIEADTFMRHMVRILVGTMLAWRGEPRRRFARAAGGPAARRGGGDGRPPTASTWRACATEVHLDALMKVLLTNDDGIRPSACTRCARRCSRCPGIELAVIAPDSNRSATARSITTRAAALGRGGRVRRRHERLRDRRHAGGLRALRRARAGRVRARADRVRASTTAPTSATTSPTRARSPPRSRASCSGIPAIAVSQQADHGAARLPRRRASWQREDFEQAAAFVARMVEELERRADARGHAAERELPGRRGRAARAPAGSGKRDLQRPHGARPRRTTAGGATGSTASSPGYQRGGRHRLRRASPTAASPSRRCTST